MKYALLIYPKPGSEEALGEDEYKSVSAELLGVSRGPTLSGRRSPTADRDGDHRSLRRP
jgi:hypothetical protein